MEFSRRAFLTGTASLVLAATMPAAAEAGSGARTLRLASRQVEIGGRAATRYGISEAFRDP